MGPRDAGRSHEDAATRVLHQVDASSSGSRCASSSLNQEGCTCNPGVTIPCYTGPAGTRGVGTCHDGIETCQSSGEFGAFGACSGEVVPATATDCIVDAGWDSGFDSGHDAQILAVGASCTPGQTQVVPAGYDAGAQCQESTPVSVLYCETASTWECFPAAGCSPAACETCMQQMCSSILGSSSIPACNQGLQEAFTWLERCGPDRSQYFQSLGAACQNNEVDTLMQCKDMCITNVGQPDSGPCSFY
jgi:hypothetical protein